MNVLRFSIQLRTQFMREERLKQQEENESILDENINSIENETTIVRVILPEQMINKCSNPKELSFFHHQSTVIRLISNNARASLSLMTTSHLPINIIETKDVEQFYEKADRKNKSFKEQAPFFNKHVFMEDQQGNEFEMIIKGKLWKGEQTKHRRRAKRT
ncbi:unnamed protein product [Rotaria socialis]|uniref:Uncharacterized protein n=1 Tax=Rotaria socialis TaxID=392032 RepID=A0A820HJD7_9BILA|nr:unnamed protein product [Rotaria socialis]